MVVSIPSSVFRGNHWKYETNPTTSHLPKASCPTENTTSSQVLTVACKICHGLDVAYHSLHFLPLLFCHHLSHSALATVASLLAHQFSICLQCASPRTFLSPFRIPHSSPRCLQGFLPYLFQTLVKIAILSLSSVACYFRTVLITWRNSGYFTCVLIVCLLRKCRSTIWMWHYCVSSIIWHRMSEWINDAIVISLPISLISILWWFKFFTSHPVLLWIPNITLVLLEPRSICLGRHQNCIMGPGQGTCKETDLNLMLTVQVLTSWFWGNLIQFPWPHSLFVN